MSFSCWVSRKFGVFIVLFYIAAIGVLMVSDYLAQGAVDPAALAGYYPAGQVYPRTAKNKVVREILGLPASDDDASSGRDSIEIFSYTDDGAVIGLDGGGRETVKASKVVRHLVNRDSTELEQIIEPLYDPLNSLLDLHLRFMKRVEEKVGGASGGLRRMIVPKIVISVVYLGLVFLALYLLRRYDGVSAYKGGFANIYASFVYWPVVVIIISVVGTSVVDMVRHLPYSYHFMRWPVTAGWAAILAWPLLVTALSAVDIVRSALRLDIGHALLHAVVLAAGIVSIPLATVGIMFAILAAAIYFGYRFVRNTVGLKSGAGSGVGARMLKKLLRG